MRKNSAEFLVEFELNVPEGASTSDVKQRENAEAAAATRLVDEGHLVWVWKRPAANGDTKIVGLHRADSETQLDALLRALRSASASSAGGCAPRISRAERH